MTELANQEWYNQLIEDCKDIVTETEFTSKWALVEGYHSLGARILTEYENFQRLRMPDTELIATVAISLNKRPRTVYYAVQFARMYPDLNLLKEGKNISWHHIINKYLTDGKEKPVKITPLEMLQEIKKLLQVEWSKANQEYRNATMEEDIYCFQTLCGFIRHLQDQFDKITGGLEL
mgnify:CR=1 FL=1